MFADHPDLLEELAIYLPEAVQEQAKEMLHRAATDLEARMTARARGGNAAASSSKSDEAMDKGNDTQSKASLKGTCEDTPSTMAPEPKSVSVALTPNDEGAIAWPQSAPKRAKQQRPLEEAKRALESLLESGLGP